MKKFILPGTVGFVAGIILTAVIGFVVVVNTAPSMMIIETESPLSHEETVQSIIENAEKSGWKVPEIHKISNSINNAGHEVLPVTVIELCKVDLAANILVDDDSKVVTSMMPCRMAVYETSDGRVIVSRMNTALVSGMFGGNIKNTMADATRETEEFLNTALTN